MVGTLGRKLSWPRSFSFRKMFDGLNSGHSSFSSHGHTPEREFALHGTNAARSPHRTRTGNQTRVPDMEVMKERFAKLLLGEDMSGGGEGVTSALALSNAIINLADSMFGEQMKLQPMYPETKVIWRKEMDWLLSVVDHIVQFVPSKQVSKNGGFTEIMVTKQRDDLLTNIPALRKLDSVLLISKGYSSYYRNRGKKWFRIHVGKAKELAIWNYIAHPNDIWEAHAKPSIDDQSF